MMRLTASARKALGLLLLCVLASVAGVGAARAADAAPKKLKVFILAGQSNMEGPANVSTFDYIGDDPATAPLLKMMRGSDGKPTVCDGVWISYLTGAGADNFTLHGKLTAGYGSMWGQDRTKPGVNIGPEFTFGLTMDAAFEEPVLLIKTAWGGKSLNTDFRPPSAGPYVLPKETQELWDQHPQGAHGIPKAEDRPKIAAEKVAATGVYYRLMIEHVKKVLADPKQVVPGYDPAQGYEIAGFAWLQGWNDAVDRATYPRLNQPDQYAMYTELLAAFIRDVRKDLDAPKMPFVIGVMGVGGLRESSPATAAFRTAMAAPADMPEFKGNVTAVQTAPFWPDELTDIEAKRVRVGQMRQALDSKHKDHANADGKMTDEQKNEFMKKFEADLISPAEAATWKRGVSNAGYHYLGCAKIFALMGKNFAEANLALLGADHDSASTTDKTASTTDKTLVAWVAPANLDQQGGSVLTIQEHTRFDAIVFGERSRGKWMAGSEGFSRTQPNQDANATETAGPDALVQLAVVYQGNTVRLYRNGAVYAKYTAQNVDLLKGSDHIAVFGLRHLGAGSGTPFAGAIEDARIYSRPLSAEEIGSLKPDVASDIAPLAWWDFEGEAAKDRAGHFAHHKAETGATIKDGRLVLDGKGSLMATCSERVLKLAAGEGTPRWPEQPPANWMTFHLAHPGPGRAEPGDPNCIFDYKGKVHLHYIYGTPAGPAFGHVSSDDMVHWKWHDTVLAPATTGHGMFSGTGFLTREGRPAIIYHAWGKGRNVVHYPADDTFDSWTKPEIVLPKKADGSVPEMRHWDPDCWLMNDTYYAYSGGQNPQLMKSQDLKNWAYLGDLLHPDYPSDLGIPKAEDISCGNMFKIGDKWMLLCISHSKGARYYLGDFKDEKYLPTFHAMMSFGSNQFFAPESVLTRDGRRVMWAWLMNMPIAPTGVQSLPRELELPADGVLRIRPLRELQSLRSDEHEENDVVVRNDAPHRLKDIRGDALEMEVTFKASAAKEFGLDVLCDTNGAHGLRVAYAADTKTLKVGGAAAPFELAQGEDLVLRVFIDRNLVEVFANDRQAVVAANPLVPGNLNVSLFSKGGDVVAKSVKGWKMKSIYPAGRAD